MKCPFCSHAETQVVETRVAEDGDFIRRRRQCGACEKRFTTYERPEVNFPAVVKKDGRWHAEQGAFYRTQRRLFDGYVYVRASQVPGLVAASGGKLKAA